MKNYKILLALSEEGPHLPSAIRWVLEGKGYHVTATLGSNPGMEMLLKESFDLVITDLPVILEKVKELNPESMAILMLTTGMRSILSVHSIRSAADDYVFIPFELAELEVRVAHCIEKAELKRENLHHPLNEKIENLSKTLLYDIRGSLISMKAGLEQLSQDCYGRMDETVMNRLKGVLSKTVCLIGVTEECLGEAWSVNADLNPKDKKMSWVPDTIFPVWKRLPSEIREGSPRLI
jgi:response regulator RpfG family c-di-GMP phosphodiesterase